MPENLKIRTMAKNNGVQLWKLAAHLGISEPTLTRWLRVPLPQEREEKILDAIQAIVAAREGVC